MKIAVIFNQQKLSGRLTKLFTGCYAYHVAWVDEAGSVMYDMNLLRRKRDWPHYPDAQVLLFAAPVNVTVEWLESMLRKDDNRYGIVDYIMFAVRPIYHLFGMSTRNAGGVICSEMVNNDIWSCGGKTPWSPDGEPPSPCDLYRWFNAQRE